MLIRKLVALAVVALAPALVAAEEENPYSKAEKGQWISYKLSIKAAGQELGGNMKQTVVEKDDKSVTLEVVTSVMGMEQKQKQVIDLTKPFNPLANANLPMGGETKVEKKESGKEAIDVDGKKLECEWTSYKTETDAMGLKIMGDIKLWMSKAVPIGGIAKMSMKMDVAGMEIEAIMDMEKSGKD